MKRQTFDSSLSGGAARSPSAHQEGFALPITIIVLAVVLISIVATMSIASIGVRRGATDERRGLQSLLVAESGLNVFPTLAAASGDTFPLRDGMDDGDWLEALNVWLDASGMATLPVAAGRSASLDVSAVRSIGDTEVITVRSVSELGGGRHVAALDFTVTFESENLSVFAPAALTSKPAIRVGGNAVVSGSEGSESDWLGSSSTVQSSTSTPMAGDAVTVSVTSTFASRVEPGEYVQLRVDTSSGSREARFRVDGKNGTSLELVKVGDPGIVPISVPADAPITHVPIAVSASVTTSSDGADSRARIPVTYPGFFRPGSELVIDSATGEQRLEVMAVDGDELEVRALPGSVLPSGGAHPIYEGATVRAFVNGAISEGSIRVDGNNSEITPGAAEDRDLPDDLVLDTFDVDLDALRRIAQNAGGYYTGWGDVPDVEQLSGITFIENSSSNNIQFCGSGILFVNGDLMTNNSRCPFTGVVFVLGDWSEAGNRQITGAVVVEGIVETCAEVGSTGKCETSVRGTGQGSDKIEFDPVALYNLGLGLGIGDVSLAERPGSWRLLAGGNE